MAIWSILRPYGVFCGHLVYFISYIYFIGLLVIIGYFLVLVFCTMKNLATLGEARM
jgi:hypothetical protein